MEISKKNEWKIELSEVCADCGEYSFMDQFQTEFGLLCSVCYYMKMEMPELAKDARASRLREWSEET